MSYRFVHFAYLSIVLGLSLLQSSGVSASSLTGPISDPANRGGPGWIINEVNADPDAANGDANGDGTVDTSEDEFVEIINATGADVDISGWTIADGFGVRHIFPANTVVTDGCGIVVFGGGTPTGAFGGVLVQTASDGMLGLNNSGDSVILNDGNADQASVNYGGEGGNNQSLTLDPDLSGTTLVQHSTANGSGGALFSPGTRIDGTSFAGCEPPPSGWIINEVNADPDATNGDANGDGTVDTSEDEFVEIINATGADVDISGWSISDAVGERHVFPANTVVTDGCGIVVFGGGSPSGTFGNTIVQTASTGLLGFNNGGDSVILNDGNADQASVSYGGEGGNNQSLTRDPDLSGTTLVEHSTAIGSGGALFSPGTRIDGTAFSGCAPLPSGWIINEVNADPDATNGDANGDGTVDTSQDEFVEIINATGGEVDITGWSISDSVGERHVFPLGTLVPNGCSIVIFGGGTPTGSFGNSIVQTASNGFLGFNNSGDSVILNDGNVDQASVIYGSEGGNNQSLTRDPDLSGTTLVEHSTAIGSGGALFSPGTRIDGTAFADCGTIEPVVVSIQEIQGTGLRSPFAPPDPDDNSPGDLVRTLDNVVTAVASNGFFIQQPDAAPDPVRGPPPGPFASRGLFVFTGSAPTTQVGDIVDVQGQVVEFFNLTQIANPDFVQIISSGNTLPEPIALDANTPSQDPANLSCVDTQFECYENMLVSITDGFVTAPSQSFGSAPVAEAFVSADGERIPRGEGAAFPGITGCVTCPVWSGAPELFEMDPRRFNLRSEPLIGGTTFNATGVMGFAFQDYVFWPTELNILIEPSLPSPAAPSDSGQVTIGSLNVLNLFDDTASMPRAITACGSTDNAEDREILSTTDYETKLNKLAVYIVTGLGGPDVLALQEVESEAVLQDLADEITLLEPGLVYTPELVFGNDRGNINNGYLINTARIANDYTIEQLAEEECLTVDGSPLHDRPPLLLRARFIAGSADWSFAVFNNHLRSLGGIANQDGRTRLKRHEQAQSTATLVQNLQTSEPDLPIIVIGDLNAFEFSDGYADVVGHLRGTADPAQNLVSQENINNNDFDDANIPNPPLALPLLDLPESERYSFIFQGVSQTLDHVLLDNTAETVFESLSYSRANADYWEGFEFDINTEAYSSDHDGLVLILSPDRLFADSFESN